MRVASWLKRPDSKLQRNSEPLLKLNSCRKREKSPQFLGQVSVAPPLNAKSLSSEISFGILALLRRGVWSTNYPTMKFNVARKANI